jgi:hypothetical protein
MLFRLNKNERREQFAAVSAAMRKVLTSLATAP